MRMNKFIEQPWPTALTVLVLLVLATIVPPSYSATEQRTSAPTPTVGSGSATMPFSGSGFTPISPCYDGELLLANSTYSYIDGYNFYGGRVEVCYNETYRPVCDNGWTDNDAAVVCNSVGYDSSYYRKSDTFVLCNTLSIPTNRGRSNKWCSLWSIR